MRIISANAKRSVDIGSSIFWNSVYLTAESRLGFAKHKIPKALNFLKNGNCSFEDALETARQFNILRDEFSKYPPSKAVFDSDKEKKLCEDNLSPVVTSCANLYITSDGRDLLFEIVSILTYGYYAKVDILAE